MGCNDKPNEKLNRGEPRYNEQNKGIMVCEYVCVLPLCVHVCVCVSRHKGIRSHTRACNHYYFIIFMIFLSTFNIDLIGHPRPQVLFFSSTLMI